MNREPTEKEIAHVWAYARRLGFDLVETEGKRFAICDRADGGRYPDSGGVTFDEIVLVLRRRGRGDW